MYFTNTPSLNSMEAIMQKPPGGAQRGGGRNRSPYKYTKKDCDCRFCLYYDNDGSVSKGMITIGGDGRSVESQPAVLYRANPDGTDRKKIFTFDAGLTLEDKEA